MEQSHVLLTGSLTDSTELQYLSDQMKSTIGRLNHLKKTAQAAGRNPVPGFTELDPNFSLRVDRDSALHHATQSGTVTLPENSPFDSGTESGEHSGDEHDQRFPGHSYTEHVPVPSTHAPVEENGGR
jgi:hypothetical protein